MTFVLHGIGISPQVAIGKARILRSHCPSIAKQAITEAQIPQEIDRLNAALQTAHDQLNQARSSINLETSSELAGFLDAHILMLTGTTLSATPIETIKNKSVSAEWALKSHCENLIQRFNTMQDPYLRSRKLDVEQVINRVLCILLGEEASHNFESHNSHEIIVANDLTPADTLLMHDSGIAAFVTESGGALSHTAILAKNLGIPAVIGVQNASQLISENSELIIDGKTGSVLLNPCDRILQYYQDVLQRNQQQQIQLNKLVNIPCKTQSGQLVQLHANVETVDDIPNMIASGADGVGLLRTEFLFMNRESLPSEEEHFECYQAFIQALNGKPLTIRTLDLGADKTFHHQDNTSVSNPALGLRAVRLCLSDANLFEPQIRAILRASAFGPVRLMVPMFTTIQEIDSVIKIIHGQMSKLQKKKIAFNERIHIGGMIETPAAVLCLEDFAKRLDFLSIGTNDLIQYTFAIDRVDESVNYLFNPGHPAILKLLKTIISTAKKHNISVSLCGEMAGDIKYTRLLLGLGLTEFSMNPNSILTIKSQINTTND
ncbi:MAG: phosphoenolpyruvate--protein phosphotransferase, partial [Methylococcales bacterium]|nr:phosphoenolpyruvate--protein phosphotransferase [Methylococcales bacterium]